MQPTDPAGHLKICASDFAKSKKFYAKIFEKLGFKPIASKEKSAAWATKDGFGIWIAQATQKQTHLFGAPGFHHLCVKAETPELVDAIYAQVKNKTTVFDAPQQFPQYTDKYYAVFFADPDGLKIEVAYY